MKKYILLTFSLFFVLLCIVGVFLKGTFFGEKKAPSIEDRAINAIISDVPLLATDGEPSIKISSVTRIDDNWYIVSITSKHPVKKVVPVTLVLVDDGTDLHTVAGPDTRFTEAEMSSLNLPDSAILELQKL